MEPLASCDASSPHQSLVYGRAFARPINYFSQSPNDAWSTTTPGPMVELTVIFFR